MRKRRVSAWILDRFLLFSDDLRNMILPLISVNSSDYVDMESEIKSMKCSSFCSFGGTWGFEISAKFSLLAVT